MRKQTLFGLFVLGAVGYFYYAYKSGAQWAQSAVCSAVATVSNMFPANWLSYGAAYVPTLNNIESQYGLPQNFLAAIAFEESSFNPNATNPSSGAQGMFQLMPQFYPGVDPFIWQDAAAAAAGSLAGYYQQFGDWQLALAAYNWGSGNLSRSIRAQGGADYNALPPETQNYVTRIASATGVPGDLVA